MAYSDGPRENWALPFRTMRDVANFRGRSQRTELAYYWFVLVLFQVLFQFGVSEWLDWREEMISNDVASLIVGLPMFALFVRRVHDQDRSGWWGLLLPPAVLLNQLQFFGLLHAMETGSSEVSGTVGTSVIILGLPAGIAILVLFFLPGTIGSNRYGSDPRESGEG